MKGPEQVIATALDRILPEGWERNLREHELKDIRAAVSSMRLQYEQLYPASAYHEDHGTVLWWHLPVCDPPYVGGLEAFQDQGSDGHPPYGWLTHFSRLPTVYAGDGLAKHPVKEGVDA